MNLTRKVESPSIGGRSAPNISLNIHRGSKTGELYAVALCGIVLQFGMLVFCGLSVYHQEFSRRFPKNGRPVETYAFPIMALGTILLMVGMLICSAAVEITTEEMEYRPVKAASHVGLLWLQKSHTVNDQSFDSFALGHSPGAGGHDLILTSRRQPDESEQKSSTKAFTLFGVFSGLCGFVLQFQVGLEVLGHDEGIA